MQRVTKLLKIFMLLCFLMIAVLAHVQKQTGYIDQEPLTGPPPNKEHLSISVNSWLSTDYQRSLGSYLKENFGFRNSAVRLHNQVAFSLFKQTNAKGVVIGKENFLYEINYIESYNGMDYIGIDSIRTRMKKLKYVQDTFAKLGKSIISVFAPGKAYFYPEYIPDHFIEIRDSLNYETYVQFAKQYGVNTIDFNKYFINKKGKLKYPLYAKNGIHWSYYGMCLASDSLVRKIESIHTVDLANLFWTKVDEDNERVYDYDVANGLNILFTNKGFIMGYPNIQGEKGDSFSKPKCTVIADSYFWGMFNSNFFQAFGKSQFWYYNTQVFPESYKEELFTKDLDLRKKIEDNDVFVIICTDGNLPHFGWGFVEDTYDLFRKQ